MRMATLVLGELYLFLVKKHSTDRLFRYQNAVGSARKVVRLVEDLDLPSSQ